MPHSPLHAVDVPSTVACKMALDADGAKLLAYAVSNHYWYQVFVDELPVWGMVGEIVAVRTGCSLSRARPSVGTPRPPPPVAQDEDAIKELESHAEKPHGIAEATFLYTHKNL